MLNTHVEVERRQHFKLANVVFLSLEYHIHFTIYLQRQLNAKAHSCLRIPQTGERDPYSNRPNRQRFLKGHKERTRRQNTSMERVPSDLTSD